MTFSEILKHEHQIVLKVISAAEDEAQRIVNTHEVDADKIRQMLDFFRNFTDRCHHAKEEKILFARMEQRGMSAQTGPIAVMLMEHAEGRKFLRMIDEALPKASQGDLEAAMIVKDALQSYCELLRAHIQKEDNILYPMAERILSPRDQQEIVAEFERVEREEMGEGTHEQYHHLAHELAGD